MLLNSSSVFPTAPASAKTLVAVLIGSSIVRCGDEMWAMNAGESANIPEKRAEFWD
jgi:hypothetical protein